MPSLLTIDMMKVCGVSVAKTDDILEDDERLAKAAVLINAHEETLRDVLTVLMQRKAIELVTDAVPEYVMNLRHGIAAIEEVFERFTTYREENIRREAKKKMDDADESKNSVSAANVL